MCTSVYVGREVGKKDGVMYMTTSGSTRARNNARASNSIVYYSYWETPDAHARRFTTTATLPHHQPLRRRGEPLRPWGHRRQTTCDSVDSASPFLASGRSNRAVSCIAASPRSRRGGYVVGVFVSGRPTYPCCFRHFGRSAQDPITASGTRYKAFEWRPHCGSLLSGFSCIR